MRLIAKNAADQTIYVEVLDSTSTTGGRKTGLVFNSAGLTAYYARNRGAATAITLATLASASAAHADGGFIEVDATNMPGVYRLDLPDAAAATGADTVAVTLKGATGMAQVSVEIQLVAFNPQDADDLGLTALTGNTPQTGDSFARLGAPAGASVSADVAGLQTDTDNIQTRLPAALVGGRVDASVGAMAADVMTAASLAADAGTEIGTAVWATTVRALTDKTGFALSSAGIQAIWDALTSALTTVGSVGKLIVDNLNASISSIAALLPVALVGGRIDASVGAMAAGTVTAAAIATGAIDADALAADAVAEIFTTQMTESYAADGVAPTLAQALFLMQQRLTEFSIAGVTITVKKLDGTTAAATLTMDDATSPTSSTRAT